MSERSGGSSKLNATAKAPERDKPWLFRTYAGHSTAAKSNELYRKNLAKGQTGLSIAFDLPTQTGYDSDHELARGEVGKVGVPVSHLGDMRTLLDGIPLDQMNTSMTINATAAWLLSLYVATADETGASRGKLTGTIQNDIIKEYLSRGTYVFPPEPSLRLIKDTIVFSYREVPKWNPTNVCSYHLQEAGATPVQELAYALATAIAVLDTVKTSGEVPAAEFGTVVGRVSFFVNAGLRFITEICKMRAFNELWDEICTRALRRDEREGPLFRYGVQVNSPRPHRAAAREQRLSHPARDAGRDAVEERARARRAAAGVERGARPAAALGPAVVAAHAADRRLRDGSPGIRRHLRRVDRDRAQGRRSSRSRRGPSSRPSNRMGGAVAAIDYMKRRLVESNTARLSGQSRPASRSSSASIAGPRRSRRRSRPAKARSWSSIPRSRPSRSSGSRPGARRATPRLRRPALAELESAAKEGRNIMEPSIACAKAGITTGEWGDDAAARLRRIPRADRRLPRPPHRATERASTTSASAVDEVSDKLGRRLKFLVGKPGLDGHSNGAEQIAVRARDVGMEVVYEGIRLTPAQIVRAAVDESAHVVGLSILSGSHVPLVGEVMERMRKEGLADIPVVVGGIIPPEDAKTLKGFGVAAVYTPKDFQLNDIMADIVRLVAAEPRAA